MATSGVSGASGGGGIRIGNRTVTPALPVVDASAPTETDKSFQVTLADFCKNEIELEAPEGLRKRERALDRIGALSREWIKAVCGGRLVDGGDPGGQLFTSGSYRLGVHEPGADIDCILVAPHMCTRQDFFGSGFAPPGMEEDDPNQASYRDPESLAERIRRHPDVTNFVPVESAAVPLLTFDWEGVNIDLLFARLSTQTVPTTLDIDNDAVLDGVDNATEKSLNGPRVTNLIAALVTGDDPNKEAQKKRYETFLEVVRCVRKWAKARGLYNNKMGYFGGVNINICVALCVQLYPNANPASLLRRFFLVFKSWRWPNPVMLTRPHDSGLGLTVWNASHVQTARQVAPIITPAYPAMNSSLSVSRQTLQILHEEFCRGHTIVDKLWKDHQKKQQSGAAIDGEAWRELFEPSDFFISYPYYLSLCIVGPTQSDAQSWAGFVESRLRKLVSDLLGKSLPLSKIQLWPKKFEVCIADRSALLTNAQRQNCIAYFVGFQVDTLRMRGRALDIERQMQNFREWELSRFQPLVQGMDVLVKCFTVKELPRIVFENTYPGGKLEGMQKRRRIRNADPKLQEKRRVARLKALKRKMANMQKKKEEIAAAAAKTESDKKRKRDDNDDQGDEEEQEESGDAVEEEVTEDVDVTPSGDKEEEILEEETNLLEHALDSIQQDGTTKTREEAEADRRRLLAGELLVEGGGGDDEEEEDTQAIDVAPEEEESEKRLTAEQREAELLRQAGYTVVSDDEALTLGGNMILPWRKRAAEKTRQHAQIKFHTKFDVVELDANGHVIDKGDNDFVPSNSWTGRRGGFEFKLGQRGVGYYRTGAKVVVPSNTSY
eukprot:scaffold57700_cov37-Attheya_sp.AAC.3